MQAKHNRVESLFVSEDRQQEEDLRPVQNTKTDQMRNKVFIAALALLSLFSVLFWKLDYYYYFFDELVMLDFMKARGWRSFFEAQNEHFAPFFKALFYLYAKLFGNAAWGWHFIVLLSHMVTIGLVGLLGFTLSRRRDIAFSLALLCGLSPLIWETTIRQGGLGTTSSVAGWLLALWCILEAPHKKSKKLLWLGIACAWIQSYTFGNALFYPALLLPVIFFTQQKGKRLVPLLALLGIQGLNLYVFFTFGSFQNNQNYQDPFSIDTVWRMLGYFGFFFYANLGRLMVTSELGGAVDWPIIRWEALIPSVVLVLASGFVMVKQKQSRLPILLGWLSYLLLVGLVSVARYRFPQSQALSSRYIYLIFPSFILIAAPVLAYFTRYFKALPVVVLLLVVVRLAFTYDIARREKRQSERMYARNYQLIVLAKSDPTIEITDFLTTGPLGTAGSVQLLNWLEDGAKIRLDHRIPDRLRPGKRDISPRIKRTAPQ